MDLIWFTVGFALIHTTAYVVAGMLALRVSSDLYKGEHRLLDFINDMSESNGNTRVQKLFLPAQLLRGVLMALVLYPVVPFLGEISFVSRSAFLFGLMFIYTDFAGAVPFPHNIEGWVYMKSQYLQKNRQWKLYFEITIYSLLFAGFSAWILF